MLTIRPQVQRTAATDGAVLVQPRSLVGGGLPNRVVLSGQNRRTTRAMMVMVTSSATSRAVMRHGSSKPAFNQRPSGNRRNYGQFASWRVSVPTVPACRTVFKRCMLHGSEKSPENEGLTQAYDRFNVNPVKTAMKRVTGSPPLATKKERL